MTPDMRLVLIGSLPFLGYYMNFPVMRLTGRPLLWLLRGVSVAVLLVWFGVSGHFRSSGVSRSRTIVSLNAPAFLVLVLLLFQEFVLGQFWRNWAGTLTQSFYLPLLALGFRIPSLIKVHRMAYGFVTAFLYLLGVSFLGVTHAERRLR